jgi:hypothetical protein
MEYDQRVIIKFGLNKRIDVRNMADRLQAKFSEYTSQLRTVQFLITEVELSHHDLHDEIRSGRSPDFLWMILIPKMLAIG